MSPLQMFESNRVKFYMQTEVSELREQEGKVGCGQGVPGDTAMASPQGCRSLCRWGFALYSFLPPEIHIPGFSPQEQTCSSAVCGVVSLLPPSSCCRYKELWSICMSKMKQAASLACCCYRVGCFLSLNNRDVPPCLMQLKEVVLKSGKVLRADVCVVGVGKGPLLRVQSLAGWRCFARRRRSWRGRGSDGSPGLGSWGCWQ